MIRFFMFCMVTMIIHSALAGVFDVNGKQPDRMIVIADPTFMLPDHISDSPMIAITQGVIHELSRDEILALRAAARGAKSVDSSAAQSPFARIRMYARESAKDVMITRDDRGMFYAESESSSNDRIRLDPTRTKSLFAQWPSYRGTTTIPAGCVRGVTTELPRPYSHGSLRVTKEELSKRLLRGRPTQLEDATRVLSDERFSIRLPTHFTPDEYAGLFVWIQASTDDRIPDQLNDWLDEANFIAITALNVGNSRPVCDRYQLALDMVSTVEARFLIDDSRVYIGGISGGARVACHLWMGWPEIFKGVLPVVGISFYDPIQGLDTKTYAPDFDKPPDSSFKVVMNHPIAAITGPRDFNYAHIAPCVERMRLAGLQARLFESVDTGHEMPPADIASASLRFIDAPAFAVAESKRQRAKALLELTTESRKSRRESLVSVTMLAPWTPESLTAMRLLAALDAEESPK